MTSYSTSSPRTLFDSHRDVLEHGSAILPEILAESGAYSVGSSSELPDVFSERQRRRAPGILFTVHRPNGGTSYSWRPDRVDPENPGHKYEQPPNSRGGAGNVLHVLPSQRHLIADTSVPVIFTEGTKKMLSLVSAARAAGEQVLIVGIVGCWNWMHNGGKPIPDMLAIPLEGRRATVMFDSDVLRKWQVQMAAGRLAEYLQERGAEAYVTYFHDLPDGSKCGADDYAAAGGTFPELRLLTRRYEPGDFAKVRLTRDEALRAMVQNLERAYQAMPTATRAECTDRATMRALIKRSTAGETRERGVVVRAPVRPLSMETRRGRQAQANSLMRLQRNGVMERLDEPKEVVEEHGAAYLLYANVTERAKSGHLRTEHRNQHNETTSAEEACNEAQDENQHRYADSYEGVHFTRAPSAAVPELRGPKCVHTWETLRGRRVVVDSEYFYRLDKTRQEIVMFLLDVGGAAHESELRENFGTAKTSLRDFRRRKLSPLMGCRYKRDKETGQERRLQTGPPIIARAEDGTIRLLTEWAEALEEHRRSTDEDGDTARQAKKYREDSRKRRERREHDRAERKQGRRESNAREYPLRGKEHNRRMVAEREREEKQRWVEEQRRKVGMTAMTFLADEIDGEYGVRFQDAAERWRNLHGGAVSELWRAAHYGPFVFRRVQGDLFIDPEPPVGNLEPKPAKATPPPERKMPPPNGAGIYVHGPECDCWICADEEEGAA